MTSTRLRPDGTASPAASVPGARRRGLLPASLVRHRRPRWWQEIALVLIGYWLYGVVRNAIPRHDSIALRHGRSIQHLQERLGLDFELGFNRWVAAHEPLAQVLDYYYATLHFVVTVAVMVWLFRARPRIYRGLRTVLFVTTLTALAGFALYPVAPPRLLPQYGYVDTLIRFHTWGSLADPKIAERSNQFAAMPSLHIAWALWSGLALAVAARHVWLRVLGALYPVATLIVITGTANHFVLDAVGGVAVVGVGFAVQRSLSGHGAFRPAPAGYTESA